ncbi:MAG TPA: YbfB/YjiJ family MFS transporter [Acidocella sp.]|jgi:MFS family permease|uniref:YbfB/YjiJ family MFS transporter n=1 Tax=Acidocella sp. TaxID=50710 RepID=UPI002B64B77E|nr:YbfB/YjiJ family MFS transporter [Acidocella sp.]HVE22338.1 YbfB/YjiJ family MFS transporter [Acidocella sp.]
MQRSNTNEAARFAKPEISGWRATLSASCASLVGIGLARFAYTPLLPAIIGAHWFAPSAAAYLGAANLAGYLAGALLGRPLATKIPAPMLLRGLMLLATVAFFACATPLSLGWFFAWRLLSGIAGGSLMVLAAPTVLPHVPHRRRGVASGAIFAGVGLGIAASGTLVPLLLREGLTDAWYGLGVLSLVLTLVAWAGWPAGKPAPQVVPGAHSHHPRPTRLLRALYVEYALNAAGLVPHMLFLVDFVARGLGQGLDSGAQYWVLFGLGAIVGPVLSGHLADRTGFGPALRLAFFVEAVAVLLPALGTGTAGLIVSSLVIGAFTPGIVPLALGRIHELLPHDAAAQKSAWSAATTGFALLQAAGAYGLTFIFAQTGGDYRLLFVIGAAAFGLTLGIDLLVGISAARRRLA